MGTSKTKTKMAFFFSWFLVPTVWEKKPKTRKKWHTVFENLQNSKMEVHFCNPKTTPKMPFLFLFLFLFGSCHQADQKSIMIKPSLNFKNVLNAMIFNAAIGSPLFLTIVDSINAPLNH